MIGVCSQGLFHRVLREEIPLAKLVRMKPEELVSKELSTWKERPAKPVSARGWPQRHGWPGCSGSRCCAGGASQEGRKAVSLLAGDGAQSEAASGEQEERRQAGGRPRHGRLPTRVGLGCKRSGSWVLRARCLEGFSGFPSQAALGGSNPHDARPSSSQEQESVRAVPEKSAAPSLDVFSSMLKDTTSQHRAHLFDLNCRVCTGEQVGRLLSQVTTLLWPLYSAHV